MTGVGAFKVRESWSRQKVVNKGLCMAGNGKEETGCFLTKF